MTAAAAGVLVSGCGGVTSGGPCPMWRGLPTITVDAAPYVRAHPGQVATMGVCLLDGGSPCDEAFAADRRVAVDDRQAAVTMGRLDSGSHRIRVVLDDAAGRVVLTTTGELVVHYTDGGRCKNLVGNYGKSRVDAAGRITTT